MKLIILVIVSICFALQFAYLGKQANTQSVAYRELLAKIQAGNASTDVAVKGVVPWKYKSRPTQFEQKLAAGMNSLAYSAMCIPEIGFFHRVIQKGKNSTKYKQNRK